MEDGGCVLYLFWLGIIDEGSKKKERKKKRRHVKQKLSNEINAMSSSPHKGHFAAVKMNMEKVQKLRSSGIRMPYSGDSHE